MCRAFTWKFFHVILTPTLFREVKIEGTFFLNSHTRFLAKWSLCLIPVKVASCCTLKLAYRRIRSRHKGPLLSQALLIRTLCSWADDPWAEVTVSGPAAGFLQDELQSTARLFYASKTNIIQSSCGSQTGSIIWETCQEGSWAPSSSGNSGSVSQRSSLWSSSSCFKVWKEPGFLC